MLENWFFPTLLPLRRHPVEVLKDQLCHSQQIRSLPRQVHGMLAEIRCHVFSTHYWQYYRLKLDLRYVVAVSSLG